MNQSATARLLYGSILAKVSEDSECRRAAEVGTHAMLVGEQPVRPNQKSGAVIIKAVLGPVKQLGNRSRSLSHPVCRCQLRDLETLIHPSDAERCATRYGVGEFGDPEGKALRPALRSELKGDITPVEQLACVG